MFWEELTSTKHGSIDKMIPVILPVGSVEQHGPALPVAVDSLIGESICRELNTRIAEDVLILSPVRIGCSQHHMDFAGTLSVSHETLILYLYDIVESVVAQGYGNILLFNTHGGNSAAVQVALEKLGNKHRRVNILATAWWKLCQSELREICESGVMGNGHAAEFEFSLMEYLFESLISYEDKSAGAVPDVGFHWNTNDLLTASKVSLFRTFREMTIDGTYGLTKDCGKEKGKKIFKFAVDRLVELIHDIRGLKGRG